MLRRIGTLGGGLGLALMAVMAVFVMGMRAKSPPVLRAVRRMNRAVFNPSQMKSAGTEGAFASIIGHVGRTSGHEYETPIGAVATEDGFVIALPYGTQADWLKNVLASGSATIVDEGETYTVDHPELVPFAEVAHYFSTADQRSQRLFGVDQVLRVQRVEQGAPVPAPT